MRLELCLPLALLFLASGVPSEAQTEEVERRVVVAEGAPLTVECALRVEQRAEWRRDGGAVPADLRPAGEAPRAGPAGGAGPSGLTARLHAAAARAHHAGLYTCSRERAAERVRVVVRPAPAPAPATGDGGTAATTSGTPAPVPASAGAGSEPLNMKLFDLGSSVTLNCSLPEAGTGIDYDWKANGTKLEEVASLKNRHELLENGAVFKLKVAGENDFGNYTCVGFGWDLRAVPLARVAHDTNVVEGQKVKMECKLVGKPYPAVRWVFSNISAAAAGEEVGAALGERAVLRRSEQGVEGGELVVEAARAGDAGWYTCLPPYGRNATTRLRVKDMYAALWPFLGICAEVFVLCAIILVYEKRRTKPEMDDSDTDNHDQKKS